MPITKANVLEKINKEHKDHFLVTFWDAREHVELVCCLNLNAVDSAEYF